MVQSAMFPRLYYPLFRPCRDARPAGKRRPASHSSLPQREPLVVATIFSLAALLVYVGVWLVRLLDTLPLAH
jgi:hypothetical protein